MDGETAEQFIVDLYHLAEFCNYGHLTSEMIRDRLVVGIRNCYLSGRLQLDSELTLEKAKKAIRQHKVVHGQQDALQGGSNPFSSLDQLHSSRHGKSRHPAPRKGTKKPDNGTKKPDSSTTKICT